ncbi:MAG: TRAP transporter large permease subunit [Alphaproteobacteria bacterium]|nr:MAG: TRAP transporter large permease subunit [Alphaproteobacteria bacterium]
MGSMCVGTVSGSGAANAITIGSATIPSMIGAGMPPATAAAIESASSLGGQLMPPVMGISAFLMAEFLGKDYFDVVARGWVPALIYYATVSTSVYLLAIRFRTRLVVGSVEGLTWRDLVNLGAFVVVVTGLVGLMATVHLAPMFAALYVFIAVGSALFVINFVSVLSQWSPRGLIEPIVRFLDAFTDMISDLALLLATLSIMTGALVITGVPTKLGSVLIEAAGVNLVAMVLLSFIFGAILGTGLPPAPTYILVAIVIAPPQSVGGPLFRVLSRRVRRADAAHFAGGRGHGQNRQCFVLSDAQSRSADLHLSVHADGRRVCSTGVGHRTGAGPDARRAAGFDGHDWNHI